MTNDKEINYEKQKTEKLKQLNQKLIFYKTIIESSADLKDANIKMIDLKWNEKRRTAYSKYSNAKDRNATKIQIEKLYKNYTEILRQQENEENKYNNQIDKMCEESNNYIVKLYDEINNFKR